jgi:hypothetical protein
VVEQVLQEKGNPPRHVYLARYGTCIEKAFFSFNLLTTPKSAGNKKFIVKNVPSAQFEYIQGIYSRLSKNQYLRLSEDAVPEHSMFVYRYFADHLLSFAQKEMPVLLRKEFSKIHYVGSRLYTNKTLSIPLSFTALSLAEDNPRCD